jgi:cell division protein FtsB
MKLPTWLREALQDKYIAVTAVALFWATFIHDLGIPFVFKEWRHLQQARTELAKVEARNEDLRQMQSTLLSDPQALERFARERYFMRRPNEEVYRIVED